MFEFLKSLRKTVSIEELFVFSKTWEVGDTLTGKPLIAALKRKVEPLSMEFAMDRIISVMESCKSLVHIPVASSYCKNLVDFTDFSGQVKDQMLSFIHDKEIEMTFRQK